MRCGMRCITWIHTLPYSVQAVRAMSNAIRRRFGLALGLAFAEGGVEASTSPGISSYLHS